jgi:hypothetical protein
MSETLNTVPKNSALRRLYEAAKRYAVARRRVEFLQTVLAAWPTRRGTRPALTSAVPRRPRPVGQPGPGANSPGS